MRACWIMVPALAVALTATACGGHPSTPTTSSTAAVANDNVSLTETGRRAVSRVSGKLTVRKAPAADAAVLTRLSAATSMGSSRVLLVEKTVSGWVQVSLPIRPNGSTGWVKASDVRVEPVYNEILVDLIGRKLRLIAKGKQIAETPVAIGPPDDPTPTGTFYVVDRVKTEDPSGAYGPFALGLSAHSPTLTTFGSGDGQIGIHGTNEPESIGKDVSHGCIRVPNKIAELLPQFPLGTPVIIT